MADETRPDKEGTERVVLQRAADLDRANGDVWIQIGVAKGSKRQAIDKVRRGAPGLYRAPSLRSWSEFHEWVEPEQQQLDHKTGD